MKKDIIKEELKNNHFRVTIFGSARIKQNDKNYKMVHSLATLLGKREIDIVTGGGPGLMKAANSGHKKGNKGKKSHSIGLSIILPKEQMSNKSLDVEKKFKRFSKRLDNFMTLSNVVVIAPGGIGTTLEFFYTLQLLQTKKICNIPIIFMGEMWKGLVDWIKKNPLKKGYLDKKDLDLIFFAKNCTEVIKIIDKTYEEFQKGGNICLNKNRYGLI